MGWRESSIPIRKGFHAPSCTRAPLEGLQHRAFQDPEIRLAIAGQYGLAEALDLADPHFDKRLTTAVQRFYGFDYVRVDLDDVSWSLLHERVDDTAGLPRVGGRVFQDEHKGPIATGRPGTVRLARPLPPLGDAKPGVVPRESAGRHVHHLRWGSNFCEMLTWLMGYETFCYALTDQPALVREFSRRLEDFYQRVARLHLQFDRIKAVFASDDMGWRGGLLF